jgi:putative heme-binding domain-containing protein
MFSRSIILLVGTLFPTLTLAQNADERLARFPALEPVVAAGRFEVADGFRVELVAAEPLVVDPVAFCFDAGGRLIVVEMRGYSERDDLNLGRVRRLSDRDADGVMDHAEVLVEGLSWPTAVECVPGGIVVATAPDLLFIPIADDDSVGEPKVWYRGFGKSNVQGLVNSLRWGLDLRLHGATSSSGADLDGEGLAEPLRLGRRDFAIDPWRRRLDATDGGGQHGMMIDPWGDKYVCSNSDHLQQVWMIDERLQGSGGQEAGGQGSGGQEAGSQGAGSQGAESRGDAGSELIAPRRGRAAVTSFQPDRRRSIADDGPQAEVFRSSPVEPWRILRTRLRVAGSVPGPIEGGGRAAGYFTGATGVWIYDGDQWPETELPIALVCDVGSNLIHRKRMTPDGFWNRGTRIDAASEFVRSSDTWFRPVQLGTGPDGALYVADMYREVIEHPKSLPPVIKSQVDLNSGNDRGRIWRIVATNNAIDHSSPSLDHMDDQALAAAIDSPNGWRRRTAARLLVDRHHENAPRSILDSLVDLVRHGQHPEGRLQGLATLARLIDIGAIETATDQNTTDALANVFAAAVADPHPRVRQRGIEYAAGHEKIVAAIDPAVWKRMAADDSIFVRFQIAMDAAVLIPDPDSRANVLLEIAARAPQDPMIRWAVEGSLGEAAGAFFQRLQSSPERFGGARAPWLASAIFQIVERSDPKSIDAFLGWLDTTMTDRPAPEIAESWNAIAAALRSAPHTKRPPAVVDWVRMNLVVDLRTRIDDTDRTLPPDLLEAKFALIRWATPDDARLLLDQSLAPAQPTWLQGAALRHLSGFDDSSATVVFEKLTQMTPVIQQQAITTLDGSQAGRKMLVDAVVADPIYRAMVPEAVLTGWMRDPAIADRLSKVVQDGDAKSAAKSEVIASYAAAMNEASQKGSIDVAAGEKLFQQNCAVCHRVDESGRQIGPDLKSVVDKSPEQILTSVIDPNREVDPKYLTVQVLTDFGQLITGIVASESDGQIELLDSQGVRHAIQRNSIESIETSGVSLMPEGFERSISKERMAELVGFLKEAARGE